MAPWSRLGARPPSARTGRDGNVSSIAARNLLRIRDGGGVRETVAELRGGELALLNPEILPGGNAILFAADSAGPVDKTTIEVVTLPDCQRKTVIQGAHPRGIWRRGTEPAICST